MMSWGKKTTMGESWIKNVWWTERLQSIWLVSPSYLLAITNVLRQTNSWMTDLRRIPVFSNHHEILLTTTAVAASSTNLTHAKTHFARATKVGAPCCRDCARKVNPWRPKRSTQLARVKGRNSPVNLCSVTLQQHACCRPRALAQVGRGRKRWPQWQVGNRWDGDGPLITHGATGRLTPVLGCQQMTDSVGHAQNVVSIWRRWAVNFPTRRFAKIKPNNSHCSNVFFASIQKTKKKSVWHRGANTPADKGIITYINRPLVFGAHDRQQISRTYQCTPHSCTTAKQSHSVMTATSRFLSPVFAKSQCLCERHWKNFSPALWRTIKMHVPLTWQRHCPETWICFSKAPKQQPHNLYINIYL